MTFANWQKEKFGREQSKRNYEIYLAKKEDFFKKYITVFFLKRQRHWTDKLIKEHLGDTKIRQCCNIKYKVFELSKVIEIENNNRSVKLFIEKRMIKKGLLVQDGI